MQDLRHTQGDGQPTNNTKASPPDILSDIALNF